ncbi:MAG: T9SS type A sorting domain-containing protein [Bacteroidetes bacterium]|nr:T9SS type A sorting domain-containing protein [Bacteroidota bacterium]
MALWEKTPGVGIVAFNIYKEILTDTYQVIGSVPFDSAGIFIDYSSSPMSHGDKYKISVVNQYGNESAKSPYHRTMNLGLSNFGSTMYLDWDEYVDESGQFVPQQYFIYRGTTLQNMQVVDSISGSFTSWNDLNVFDVYYYMVGVSKLDPCDVGAAKTLYSSAFSNQKDNSDLVNINEPGASAGLSIYPNPFSDKAIISFDNPQGEIYTLVITDLEGKEVMKPSEISSGRIEMERGDLAPGVYFMEIKGNGILRGKLVIE